MTESSPGGSDVAGPSSGRRTTATCGNTVCESATLSSDYAYSPIPSTSSACLAIPTHRPETTPKGKATNGRPETLLGKSTRVKSGSKSTDSRIHTPKRKSSEANVAKSTERKSSACYKTVAQTQSSIDSDTSLSNQTGTRTVTNSETSLGVKDKSERVTIDDSPYVPFLATAEDLESPEREETPHTIVSVSASTTPCITEHKIKKKSTSKKKKKKWKIIMRRICFRIPKLICYLCIALLLVFALRKLNQMSAANDEKLEEESKLKEASNGDDSDDSVTNVYFDDKLGLSKPTVASLDEKNDKNGANNKDYETYRKRKERDVEMQKQVDVETRDNDGSIRVNGASDDKQVEKDEHEDFDHDIDEFNDVDVKPKVERKLVEHKGRKDFHYEARGKNDKVVSGKTFNIKPVPDHMAEIVMEEAEPENEADPAHAVFVTGASRDTFHDVMQLLQSLQKFLPSSRVLVYDLGLQYHEKLVINRGCKIEVRSPFLAAFPDHVQIVQNRNWRPIVMQMALAEFHFIVWVDPKTRLLSGRIEPILKLATTGGVGVLANPGAYSTFTVTHPSMYDFIPTTDYAKYIKEPHLEIKMLAIHSTEAVQDNFMRWLALCATEKDCLAPSDARYDCEHPLRTQRYAKCHRYEESAVNILLKNWYKHDIEKFYVRNLVAIPVQDKKIVIQLKQCERTRDL